MMIHAFFGEIGYEPSSSNFKSEDVFDYTLDTLNHTKDFKFGGYTELEWDKSGSIKQLNQHFYFQLIIKLNIQEEIIYVQYIVEKI